MTHLFLLFLLLTVAQSQDSPVLPKLAVSNVVATAVNSNGVAIAPPIRCDEKDNIFARLYPSGAHGPMPITRIAGDGQSSSIIDLQKIPDLPERSSIRDFSVAPNGEIYLLVQAPRKNMIVQLKADGQFLRKLDIDKIGVDKFAVYKNGDFLFLGIERPTPENPNITKPFNALYDRDGKFLKLIEFEDDEKIKKAADDGDSEISPNGAGTGNRAVGLGTALAGPDGNAYAMRFMSPPIFYVISPAGEVVRKFTVGDRNQIPLGVQVASGRMLVFLGDKNNLSHSAVLIVVNTLTGDEISRYDVPAGFGSALACYDGTDSLWFGGNKNGKLSITKAAIR